MKNCLKTNLIKKATTIVVLLMMVVLSFSFFDLKKTYAEDIAPIADEVFIDKTIDNGKFAMKMTANSRKSTSLKLDERTVTNSVGQEVTYTCFTWRELESLKFRFSASIKNSTLTYKSYKFSVTNIQTENLKTAIGASQPTTLYQGNIATNLFSQFDFYYYTDKNADINQTATRCTGNDFGIYKFDFSYTYLDEDLEISVSLGEIYIAVLPDDIDSIQLTNTKILYSISSSNKLMNVFNLYLSNDTFKYANPAYIQWNVLGVDQMNNNYVLSQQIKDSDINFSNYKTIWQSLSNTTGTNFIFDSNDIEGTWNAYCTIYKTDGTEKAKYSALNLSTIKKTKKSYVWLILLVSGIAILAGGIVGLVVFKIKQGKVW